MDSNPLQSNQGVLPLRILQVEDVATEAALTLRALQRAGLNCEGRRVETEADFRRELDAFRPDIVLSDFSMPQFNGMHALQIAAAEYPAIPFIFLSGTLGEENAVRALKNGATDYVLKTNLVRLPGTIERAISESAERRARQQAERQLLSSKAGLSRAQSVAKLAHIVFGVDGIFETWSESLAQLIGLSAEDLPRNTSQWLALIHPADHEFARKQFVDAVVTRERMDGQYRIRHANGDWINIEQVIEPLDASFESSSIPQWFCTLQNITDRQSSEQRIKRLNRVYAVLSGINSAIVRIRNRRQLFKEACRIIVEQGGFTVARIATLDPVSGKLTPTAQAGLLADVGTRTRPSKNSEGLEPQGLSQIALREKRAAFANDIQPEPESEGTPVAKKTRQAAINRGVRSVIALPLFVGGKTFGVLTLFAPEKDFFDEEEVKLLTELASDISFAMDYIEKDERLTYLAYYDALTGLPNRSLFQDRLAGFIRGAAREKGRIVVVLINLNRFRHLNDTLGRETGDTLLRIVASRLAKMPLEHFSAAHIGADTFAVGIAGIDENISATIPGRILGVLGEPYLLDANEIRISANGGVALYPRDGADAETLLRNAEAALKEAKSSGERYLFYASEMNAHVAGKLALENKLRQAVERREFVLHYQPKLSLRDGTICGLEALIRWNNPETGLLVPPLKFIPLLEETGLIVQVGAWALAQAASDYRAFLDSGIPCPPIAVNVSPLQFRQKNFANSVAEATGWKTGQISGIDLELTESVIMENIESNIVQLLAVREMGIDVAIDDFGTGYSSLAYIARLPVTTLKIDRSFVLAMKNSKEDRTIISTIISLAHSLGLQVVAEGVETQEQLDELRLLDCDEMQGYLFSAPVPVAKIEAILRNPPQDRRY